MFFALAVVFAIGLSIGSFLNVVIDRIPNKQTIVRGRSYCDHCKRTLSWYELIPLLSYLKQGGKSLCCKKPLSVQYLVIELLTGIITVLTVITYLFHFPVDTLSLIVTLVIIYSLIVVSVIDLKLGIIPDECIYFLIVLFALYQVAALFGVQGDTDLWLFDLSESLFTALSAGAFFAVLIYATNGKGMGGGDLKLAFVLGLFLPSLLILIALYSAFISGGIVATGLLATGGKRFGQTVPFGPFIALGGVVSLLWGNEIIKLYLTVSGLLV